MSRRVVTPPKVTIDIFAVYLSRRVRSCTHGGVGRQDEQSSLQPDQYLLEKSAVVRNRAVDLVGKVEREVLLSSRY